MNFTFLIIITVIIITIIINIISIVTSHIFYIIKTLLYKNYIIYLNINIHIFIIYFKIYFFT